MRELEFARRFDGVNGSAIRDIFKLLGQPGMRLDSGAFSETLEALDADLISSLYGLESQPEAAAVYTSTGATAEEIAVLVFSTQEEAANARKALEARVSDQKDACEGYLPSELPKLEQAIVKESGSSVLLVVANDSQAAQAALDGLAQ